MRLQDLMNEQKLNLRLLDQAIGELKVRGANYARCEHDYRVALAKFIVEQRAEGIPVTIISDISRGNPEIARKRMEKDIAESLYESCKEAINAYKLKIRVIDAQIEREWHSSGNK